MLRKRLVLSTVFMLASVQIHMQFHLVRAAVPFAALLLGSSLLYLFNLIKFDSPGVDTGLVLLMTVVKVACFLFATLHWIQQTVSSSFHRQYLMSFLVLQVLLIVFSFALDYYYLYQINSAAFHLPADRKSHGELLLTFLYFSLGKYTTAGVGDIHPTSPAAQICAMGEMVVSYFTTVLLIANVSYLQALFSRKAEE